MANAEIFSDLENSLDFLRLQKQLSSRFCLSSSSTLSAISEALAGRFRNGKETIVVLEADKTLIQILEKLTKEIDMYSHNWLVTSTYAVENLENLTIPLASEFIFARGSMSEGYDLSEMYDTRPKKRIIKALGRWVANGSIHFTTSEVFFSRRKNLEGTTLRVLSSRKDPCAGNSFTEGVASIVECIHKTIWDILAEMLNATTEIVLKPHLDRDSILETNVEISLRSSPLNAFDLDTRWYFWPLFKTKVEVVTSYLSQEVEWKTFLLPFNSEMWMIILFWMVLCDLIMAAFEFITEFDKSEMGFWRSYRDWSFTAAFIFFNQEVLAPSKSTSIRIVLVMMFIVTGVLFPGYSASLTSFLTINPHRKPFRNLEELSRTKEYKIGWHRSFPLENMFNLNDQSPLNTALLQNNVLPQEKMPSTDIEAVEKMCNEKFTFLAPEVTIFALKPKCSHYKFKQHFRTVFTSMEMRRRSWYFYFLNRCLRTLEFTGVAPRLKLHGVIKFYIDKEQQLVIGGNASPVRIQNIVLPFAVLFLGVIFSIFFLALEKCSKRPLKQNRGKLKNYCGRKVSLIKGSDLLLKSWDIKLT